MDYSKTPPYFLMAAMASVKTGRFMYFVVNCENMLNYTQSKKSATLYRNNIQHHNLSHYGRILMVG